MAKQPTKPKIEKLNPLEREWLDSKIESAAAFVTEYSGASDVTPIPLESLDKAYSAWFEQGEDDTDEVNEVINIVGLSFGSVLVASLGFKWVVSTDEHGTELAVLALPGRGDVLVHPADFVAKRWERGETNFLVSSFEEIREQVASIAKMHGAERTQ
jgi:hypothetical protein